MIYAEKLNKPGGNILDRGVFLSFQELAVADKAAREVGECWSGSCKTNIALDRYRRNRCMFCGAQVGQLHHDCIVGQVNTSPHK